MEIRLMRAEGLSEALFGIGLSYELTSEYEGWDDVPFDRRMKLQEIASFLCRKGGGEDKFLRQVMFWWDVKAPRYWWCEADTYKVGTTAQSESTMHTVAKRPLTQDDFGEWGIPESHLAYLNRLIAQFNATKGSHSEFIRLKNALPEGYLQRRIWTLSLANMKNIYCQRKRHRLPQWQRVCEAFVEATPDFLRGMYD